MGPRSAAPPAILRTPRLVLRPATQADLAALHALWTDPEIRRHLFDDRVLAPEESQRFLAASDAAFREHGFGIWVVLGPGDPQPTGFAGLLAREKAPPSLMYGTRSDLAGRGIATEAARGVIEHAHGALGLARLHADVDEGNTASVRVLGKLGFVPTGERLVAGRRVVNFGWREEGEARC